MLNAEIIQDAEQRRLAWRCRRGMLELDIVLQRFVNEQFGGLTLAEMHIFDEMLELADNDFWELIQSAEQVNYEADVQSVLRKLSIASQQNTQGGSMIQHHHIGEEPIALDARALGDYWPGIQLYYPPVKYAPSLGIYEDMDQASARMKKHAHFTNAHTLIFDLEDGCRQKEMSRELLRKELPQLRKINERVTIAIRANSFRTDEYEEDMKLVRDMGEYIDVVMLAKAGEAYGAAEVRDLSSFLISVNPEITIQPIIEHPKSLKIAPDLMQYNTVKHVVFGIHDFSKAMGIHITPENWIEELFYFINQLLFEARIAGKGVIGGVETLIGSNIMPEKFLEPHDVRRWLDLHGDNESRVVYKHACKEAAMGLTGKQVIHPGHIHLCKTAYTPSPTEIAQKVSILKAAIEADALLGGAIKFEGEMLDPPMFGKALQTLLRAHALRALKTSDMEFALHVLQLLPAQVVRQNWPYGVLL